MQSFREKNSLDSPCIDREIGEREGNNQSTNINNQFVWIMGMNEVRVGARTNLVVVVVDVLRVHILGLTMNAVGRMVQIRRGKHVVLLGVPLELTHQRLQTRDSFGFSLGGILTANTTTANTSTAATSGATFRALRPVDEPGNDPDAANADWYVQIAEHQYVQAAGI